MTIEQLTERSTMSGGRVNRELGIIYGVKILGRESRNGRTYTEAAMQAAVPLYEGAKVNVEHPPKNNLSQPRGYQERFGSLKNVTATPSGLYADFHFNPKHALAEQLLWDAEHAPNNVGFSHNAECRTAKNRVNGKLVIEAILSVTSVDLVADPATTAGLFESTSHGEPEDTRTFTERLRDAPTAAERASIQEFAAELKGQRSPGDKASTKQFAESLRR